MKNSKTKTISIKRRLINITQEQKDFIFKNINYYRYLRNIFVEESRKYEPGKFNSFKFKTKYYNEVELPANVYNEYCVGLSEQISKDVYDDQKRINKSIKKGFTDAHLNFKKYNIFRGSFKVHLKGTCKQKVDKSIVYYSRFKMKDNKKFSFRIRENVWCDFETKDEIFSKFNNIGAVNQYISDNKTYRFKDNDIKTISFLHENGRFYIIITVNVEYEINEEDKKQKMCSIDLGIHHPGMMYTRNSKNNEDYNDNYCEIKMSQKALNRIHYLERRIKRLQHIMDKKLEINKIRVKKGEISSIYTKNYNKLILKFRITWRKIKNIRRNWIKKSCNKISKTFRIVVVDKFKQPYNVNTLYGSLLHRINYYNRLHGMSLWQLEIEHQCFKHGSWFIEAPKFTTRTCSRCGYINPKLPLSKRIFTCEKCGYRRDRDMNASRNGYNMVLSVL